MSSYRTHRNIDPELTLGGRFAAAFASLFSSIPVTGLLWLLFNSQIAMVSDKAIPFSYLGSAIMGLAVFSFAFPKFAPNVLGWLWELVAGIARWW